VNCRARPNRSLSLVGIGTEKDMLEQYFPILMFIGVGLALGVLLPLLGSGASRLLGVHRPDPEKLSPYECGFEAFEDARMKFDVRYYLVAILFILFDLEIAFLFPWAVVLPEIGRFGFVSMMVFLGILVVGFVYEWKKGALEWE
jgi:NADH-quinone oxidoreductase subunit A